MAGDLDLSVTHVLSEPPEGWSGPVGVIDETLIRDRCERPDKADWLYVVCGPPAMAFDLFGLVDTGELFVSIDNGQSWQSYHVETLGIHSTNFDYSYLLNTGHFRFQTYSTTTGKVKVWTVGFAGNSAAGTKTSELLQKINTKHAASQE